MTRRILAVLAIVLVAAGIIGSASLFVVEQTEQALVLQFGEPRRVIRTAGLWFKRPFIENVVYFDNRVLDFEPRSEEVIASDQKRLVVDSYTRFRIVDPLLFFQTLGAENAIQSRMSSLVSGALRRVLGNNTLSSLLSQERPAIMRQIRDEVNGQAKSFGIDVIDVRLRRADLPEENSQAIFTRMQSERDREAREFRAQGDEIGARIRAIAERERTITLAEAQRDAQKLRGQGDADSIKIYADAFSQDPEFFEFYRSMQAYREALNGRDTSFVLSPDSGFFRYFGDPTGQTPSSPPRPPAPAPAASPPAQ